MWRRVVQILGLLLCITGWVSVGCTLAMDHWRVTQLGGQGGSSVVETAWYWSDLWRDCYEDSTALVNCVDFGVLWNVKSDIQAVRGLLMIGICLGLITTTLLFFGLECTRIGGDQRSKDRMLIAASALHLLGCLSVVAGYCFYINRVTAAVLHSKADPSKRSYVIGLPLYLGLVGAFLILLGCSFHCATACRVIHRKRGNPAASVIRDIKGVKEVQREKKYIYRQYPASKRSDDSKHIPPYTMCSVVLV